ncbi:MAG: phage major capsid protein [Alcanivoracaceae bacterium]|nr:phage major capsid protein [Alcanivoracaceae bacterium]
MRIKYMSPTFLMSVLAAAAAMPLLFGYNLEALVAGFATVLLATLAVVPGASSKRHAFGQLGEVGEVNVEAEYKRVQASLKEIGDDLKAYAEKAQKEVDLHKTMSEQTRAKVDELLTTQAELNARLQAAEQALVSGSGQGGAGRPKSMGQVVAESEEFANNAERVARAKGSFSVPVQAAISTTQSDGSNGYPVDPQRVPGIVGLPERRLTIRDLLSWGRTSSNSIEYVKETGFTNSANVVAEAPSNAKPESDLTFSLTSAAIATIAHWVHASKQVLSDASMLQGFIDGRLRYGLALKEELQLLKGSGAGLNINGLNTQASAFSNPGVEVSSQTKIDTLRIAMLQVALAEYTADGIVLHPTDWTEIELTKDSQSRYVFANPTSLAGPTLWGLPVVATQSQDQGDFLTGAFRMGAQGWDREDASVMISTEDRDNFVKNMVTILCEERIGLTVYRPEAFVRGDFGSNN